MQPVLTVQAQQQLLNGFGRLANTRYIVEARNTRKVAELQLQAQIITTVTATKNAYWELVYARENVKVQATAVATSQHLYSDNKKQVEIGTLAPIEIVRAESELATDQQNQIVAQTTQLQDETVLLNYITKDPLALGLTRRRDRSHYADQRSSSDQSGAYRRGRSRGFAAPPGNSGVRPQPEELGYRSDG